MTDEPQGGALPAGLLLAGYTTTQMFDDEGTVTRELIFLNQGTGVELRMPISQEQEAILDHHLAASVEAALEEEPQLDAVTEEESEVVADEAPETTRGRAIPKVSSI